MTLNYLSLVNHVVLELDEDELTSATFSTDTSVVYRRVKNYINLVYREVFLEKTDWSWARLKQSFSTSAGTYEYGPGTLSALTDYERIEMVYIGDEPPMELLHYTEFFRKYGAYRTDGTGKPFVAYILDNKIGLYPTPSEAYTINVIGSKLFSELSAYDDEPLVPEGKRQILVYGALWHAKLHEKEGNEAQAYSQLYQKTLQRLRDAEGNNHKTHAIIPEEETVTAEYYESIFLE